MRLGIWNRLAVVAAALSLLFAPVTFQALEASQIYETRDAWYQFCLSRADGEFAARDACLKERIADSDRYTPWTWEKWRENALATIIVCAIVYALIWGIVTTCKWVWAGRRPALEKPDA